MSRTRLTLAVLLSVVVAGTLAQRRPVPTFKKKSAGLELPNNATSIRENIVDTFSCDNRIYGYYADIDNDCQIFHICVPTARNPIRFSFICPAETVFNQATFVCTRTESSIPCEESEKYYSLNEAFGKVDENSEETVTDSNGNEIEPTSYPSQRPTRPTRPTTGQHGSSTYPTQRPTRPTTYPTYTPDYQTTQFTQRPPSQTQNKKRRQ